MLVGSEHLVFVLPSGGMPGLPLNPSVAEVVLRLARPRRLHGPARQAEGDGSARPLVRVPALRDRAASRLDGDPHGTTEEALPSLLEELQRVPDFRRAHGRRRQPAMVLAISVLARSEDGADRGDGPVSLAQAIGDALSWPTSTSVGEPGSCGLPTALASC